MKCTHGRYVKKIVATTALGLCTPIMANNAKIVGGTTPNVGHPSTWSVVSIFTHLRDANGNIELTNRCTGTVVAHNLIVTAAHCFDEFWGSKLTSPNDIEINFTTDANAPKITQNIRLGKEYKTHPEFNKDERWGDDIAWVKFDGGLPAGYKPIRIIPTEKITSGNPIELAGFGAYGDATSAGGGQLRAVTTKFNTAIINNPIARGSFVTSGFIGKNACFGDSGGPSYYWHNNEWFLVGAVTGEDLIVSKTETCDSGNALHASVAFFAKSWIEPTSGVTLNVLNPELVRPQAPMDLIYSLAEDSIIPDDFEMATYNEFSSTQRKKIVEAYLELTIDHARARDLIITVFYSNGDTQILRNRQSSTTRITKNTYPLPFLKGKMTDEVVGFEVKDVAAGVEGKIVQAKYNMLIAR